MATPQHKSFCVLEFATCNSVITVQRRFRLRYQIDPPNGWNIRRWYRQFVDTGCVCKGKSPGRPRVSEENVAGIQAAYQRSPTKSTRRASRELQLPKTTVWRVLRRRLVMKPYKLQLLQALNNDDKHKRVEFSGQIQDVIDNDNNFSERIVFSDEACFHLSGKVNKQNVRIWGLQNPHAHIEHFRDSQKVNVFCAISCSSVYGPFFFDGNTVNGTQYLHMLQNWLFPRLNNDNLIFQQDGAPPHWSRQVRQFLNETLPNRWIGRQGADDLALFSWPPRSPDLTPCDFFLWGLIKDTVYVPPLPQNLDELKNRIRTAITSVTPDMLCRVWQEFEYRCDIVRVAGGGHIEHL